MNNITLSSLRTSLTRNENNQEFLFSKMYERLVLRQSLTRVETQFMYRVLNYFSLYGDADVQKMAYSMALNYGLLSNDFLPLIHFANLLRYYPVSMLIRAATDRYTVESEPIKNMNDLLDIVLTESYKGNYYRSEQQYELSRSVERTSGIIVVAPTSYGKSHLMVSKAVANFSSGLCVCIVVPTKSLMNQTISMVVAEKGSRIDVITHPDMYVEKYHNNPFIAVLTQERLIALLARHPGLAIDYLFIDESHNLFKDEDRSLTLSRAIMIANNRSQNVATDYFSPFIANPNSSLRFMGEAQPPGDKPSKVITEYMKIPRYFIWDNETAHLALFDQFTARFYGMIETATDYYQILLNRGADKNIVYMNKPSEVERFADALAARMPEIEYSTESQAIVNDAYSILSSYVHRSYNLIKLLKRGVVLNHGKMPDIIKEHVEFLYRNVPEIRFIVTTSTLLEGVNVPASKLFLMNYSRGIGNLDIPDFKNLAGRVGRYNTIFDLMNPKMELLTPEIYIIKNNDYMANNANAEQFLLSHAKEGVAVIDDIDNPLLVAYDGSDKEARLINETSVLANIDRTRAGVYSQINHSEPLLAQTELGASCYVHNVKIFDVVRYEQSIFNKMTDLLNTRIINNGETLLRTIISVFLETTYQVDLKIDKHKYGNWIYLLYINPSVRDVYKKIIDEKAESEASFSTLIARSVSGWRNKIGTPVYVGDIGSCDARGMTNSSWNKYHVFLDQTRNLMPSYAAALAKENLDNIDHYIVPFLEILNDFGIVSESFYKQIKYGTDNDFMITLIRAGVDFGLAKIIYENDELRSFIVIEQESPICSNKDMLLRAMSEMGVSIMYINSARELL